MVVLWGGGLLMSEVPLSGVRRVGMSSGWELEIHSKKSKWGEKIALSLQNGILAAFPFLTQTTGRGSGWWRGRPGRGFRSFQQARPLEGGVSIGMAYRGDEAGAQC